MTAASWNGRVFPHQVYSLIGVPHYDSGTGIWKVGRKRCVGSSTRISHGRADDLQNWIVAAQTYDL